MSYEPIVTLPDGRIVKNTSCVIHNRTHQGALSVDTELRQQRLARDLREYVKEYGNQLWKGTYERIQLKDTESSAD